MGASPPPRRATRALLAALGAALALAPFGAGRSRGEGRERDVDLLVAPSTAVLGAPLKDQLGNDVRLGDVDGDGVPDLLMGAHWGSDGGRNIVGRAYAAMGRQSWPAVLDLTAANPGVWSFMGRGREARLGVAVAAGDVSGDGTADLVIGSLLADPFDQANGGAVYAMLGRSGASGHVDLLEADPDVLIAGNSTPFDSDRLGTDLAIADLNADGTDDLIAAAVLRDGFRGAVLGWWGPLRAGTVINLRDEAPDWLLLGPAATAYFGASLATGDLDGDGIDDLAVGAWSAGAGAPTDSGAVFVFRGVAGLGGTLDMARVAPDTLVLGPPGALISGALSLGTCSCRGRPLAIADLDGDGANDLVAGAPLDDGRRGSVYVLPGPLAAPRYALPDAPHLRLGGAAVDDRLGWSVATGHLDGDGRVDLVAAAPWSSALGRAKVGAVYGLRGPLPTDGVLDLVSTAPLRVVGPTLSDGDAGLSLALGDTDGDGADDLHVGFPDADPVGRQAVGAVYRLAGPLLPTLAPPPATPTPTVTPTTVPTEPATPPEPSATPSAPAASATPDAQRPTATPDAAPPSPTTAPEPSATPRPTRPPSPAYLPLAFRRRT